MSNERSLQEKPIPSHYLPIEKQIEILKALAVFHGKYNKGVTYKEVSSTLGYDKNQVSSSLKFWKDIGLLAADKATYIPTPLLVEFNQKIQWGEDDEAWKAFRKAVDGTWFVNHVKLKFQIKKSSIPRDELSKSLGANSGVVSGDKNKQKSISILIDLMEKCKIIVKGENENYNINSDTEETVKKLIVDESKEMIQVKINNEVYSIDTEKIKNFVLNNGKKTDTSVKNIG